MSQGRIGTARTRVEEALEMATRTGDEILLINTLHLRAEVEFISGHTALAVEYSAAAVAGVNAIPSGKQLLARASRLHAYILLSTADIDGAETARRRAFSLT